ncbi:MAG: serine protease [Rhodospirillaceae bacterium]|nr:serine protease [Rhodospirillaceae bacterium]|tara:strand:- start:3149 stop:4570 length:1422 start_codon:yes stop_codon:yes gene_type:complete
MPHLKDKVQICLFIVMGLAVSTPMASAEKRLPQSQREIQLSYAPLVKRAAPAVVNIYTKRVVQSRRSPFFNDPFFRQFFGDDVSRFGAPRKRVENSLGSGVIVRPEGIVVTNNHVIKKADRITVVLSDRREFAAKVILADEKTDIAILRLQDFAGKLPYLRLRDSDDLEVGDLVLAIGNPFGVGQTVTGGIVSALARAADGISDFSFFIQTDAAINPGNSGGALITMDGRLVGINTAIYSRSGGSQGIGFAIPANMVGRIIDNAIHGAKIVRPWLGAAGQSLTSDLMSSLGLSRPSGVLINEIYEGGPAAKAGLKPGDVILRINNREVIGPRELRFRIATLKVGGKARLTRVRRGKEKTVSLSLQAPPEKPPRQVTTLKGQQPLAGATVANMSPALAEELSLDPMRRGVIVVGTERRSPAQRIGLRPGDWILEINGTKVDLVSTLRGLVENRPAQWRITVQRKDRVFTAVIEG